VLGGGSELGIAALLEGRTDIAATSRPLTESEKAVVKQRTGMRPQEIVIALDAIGVYVHNNNPITRLTLSQLKDILTGEIRNWRDVGGMNRRVDIYNRDKNSGTRSFIQDYVLAGQSFSTLALEVSSTPMVTACVARSQGAIGYGGIAYSHGARIIRMANNPREDGVWPSQENVSSGNYPLSRPLYFYIHPTSLNDNLGSFIDWLRSSEWQSIVTSAGYYPAPSTKATELSSIVKRQPVINREPVLLTRENMKQYGFNLDVTLRDEDDKLRPGQVMLTIRFKSDRPAIQRIKSLSLRIGEDVTIPVSLRTDLTMEFALRKSLIGKTSLTLIEARTPQDDAVYIVHLIVFCSQDL
jgi:phosphate transport system substrate-binding protein